MRSDSDGRAEGIAPRPTVPVVRGARARSAGGCQVGVAWPWKCPRAARAGAGPRASIRYTVQSYTVFVMGIYK